MNLFVKDDSSHLNAGNEAETTPIPRTVAEGEGFFTDSVARNTNNNYQDMLFRQGSIISTSLSARGGNEKMIFFVNGAYRNEKGIVARNDLERITTRANVEYQASKKVKFGFQISGSYNKISVIDLFDN